MPNKPIETEVAKKIEHVIRKGSETSRHQNTRYSGVEEKENSKTEILELLQPQLTTQASQGTNRQYETKNGRINLPLTTKNLNNFGVYENQSKKDEKGRKSRSNSSRTSENAVTTSQAFNVFEECIGKGIQEGKQPLIQPSKPEGEKTEGAMPRSSSHSKAFLLRHNSARRATLLKKEHETNQTTTVGHKTEANGETGEESGRQRRPKKKHRQRSKKTGEKSEGHHHQRNLSF